ncbi:MAG TPA: 50S ribosomal protein L13 [candidate division Zixibacteria bacterium]|jgi:large subunit ribosomal protein L13|nr:50S ribosomal protein L13 [candidate division Zixibacteria bacterium]
MRSYVAKKGDIEHRWHLVDAKGKSLGRLATRVAWLLQGKGKPQYTPHVDCGDHVVVVNAKQIRLTGNKADTKRAYRHSGHQSGLRTIDYGKLLASRPGQALRMTVKGMLPKTNLGRLMVRKMHVYGGPEHPHAAQDPKALEI